MATDYGGEIAKAALSIGAIKLNVEQPFQWASGYRMPIYNDNRMLLGSFDHRMLVCDGLVDLIKTNGLEYDGIAGTSTAGIAPAATLAQKLSVPLFIMQNGEFFRFMNPSLNGEMVFDLAASTCPWAIPYGVAVANKAKTPFAYVRKGAKDHGTKQKIEGIVKEGQRAVLIDVHRGDSYGQDAKTTLEEKTGQYAHLISVNMSQELAPVSVKDIKLLIVEDLISTGGSSAAEFKAYRDAGANIEYCVSIFNYLLGVAEEEFRKVGGKVLSLLVYRKLLEVAANFVVDDQGTKYLHEGDLVSLEEWREDAFNWGAKHGFPKVEKGEKK